MSANEALERRIDELCRENERLRQYNNTLRDQIDTAKHNSVRNTREYARLCHVNDKLRELVRDMWAYITEPVCKRNNLKERLARFDDIADRMRELGIEVEA